MIISLSNESKPKDFIYFDDWAELNSGHGVVSFFNRIFFVNGILAVCQSLGSWPYSYFGDCLSCHVLCHACMMRNDSVSEARSLRLVVGLRGFRACEEFGLC